MNKRPSAVRPSVCLSVCRSLCFTLATGRQIMPWESVIASHTLQKRQNANLQRQQIFWTSLCFWTRPESYFELFPSWHNKREQDKWSISCCLRTTSYSGWVCWPRRQFADCRNDRPKNETSDGWKFRIQFPIIRADTWSRLKEFPIIAMQLTIWLWAEWRSSVGRGRCNSCKLPDHRHDRYGN